MEIPRTTVQCGFSRGRSHAEWPHSGLRGHLVYEIAVPSLNEVNPISPSHVRTGSLTQVILQRSGRVSETF